MTDPAARLYDFRVIALDLIDPPPAPMRESFDPAKLEELTHSIRDKGIVSPIGVYASGDRFVVIYGHRRRVAAELAGELAAPCRVHPDGTAREEDYKFTENYYREEVNPAEEATWFAHLLETKHAGQIEPLAAELRLSVNFLNGRLDLLRGDPAILQALREKRLNLAVARELNKIRNPAWRAHYLADAIEMGATAAMVRTWRTNAERTDALQAAAADPDAEAIAPSTAAPIVSQDLCILCLDPGDNHETEFVRVHRSCLQVHRRAQRGAAAT
jgi:ParB family chromosome partitioning protein